MISATTNGILQRTKAYGVKVAARIAGTGSPAAVRHAMVWFKGDKGRADCCAFCDPCFISYSIVYIYIYIYLREMCPDL